MITDVGKKIIKYYLLVLFFSLLALPVVAQALFDKDKPTNCWTKQQCIGAVGEYQDKYFFKEIKDKVFQERCQSAYGGGEFGKCYAKPEEIELQVAIPDPSGGKELERVAQFPDYLKSLYTFFTFVASIVAVAYIAFGGFQWIMATGSSEKIRQAKDTIQGALIGLLLVVGSYIILTQINSRLVNFDYMRVERIRPLNLGNFCVDMGGINDWIRSDQQNSDPVFAKDTWCNFKYFSKQNPNNTCLGLKCGKDNSGNQQYCLPDQGSSGAIEEDKNYLCRSREELRKLCSKVEASPENCDFFDQYLVSTAKVYAGEGVEDLACRYRTIVTQVGIEIGFTESNVCAATEVESLDSVDYGGHTYDMRRISCSAGGNVCMEGGEPRVLEWFVPGFFANTQAEVTCTDSPRAAKGTDSICVMSNQSKCSPDKPEAKFFSGYFFPPPNASHDMPRNEWVEVSCSQVPPVGGSCNSKCWVLIVNWYTPTY